MAYDIKRLPSEASVDHDHEASLHDIKRLPSEASVDHDHEASLHDIKISGITKSFYNNGEMRQVLRPVNILIPHGKFVSIIGPSGCGKSTLFNIVAGLLPPTSGDITIGEKSILGEKGYVGYMLQKDMLLPWRTIIDNIILGLEIKGVPKREARKQALPLMEKYGLSGFEKNYPCELSGGMRQRAALLRTLLYDREIILLDEPFGALDAQTRQSMQNWLLEIWEDFHKTVLFVTHDMDEAIYLSDIIYVFSGRPGYVKEKITVHLKRPRKQEDMLETDFWDLKQHLMGGMSDEKRSAYEVEYYEPKSVLAMQADRREEKHRRKQKKGIRAGRILLGVAILLFWEVSARLGWIDDYYWSSPSLIAQTAIVQWKEKNLAYDIYFTSMSTIGGFLAGTLGGAVLGLSFWWSKTFAKIFEPYLVMFNAIPKLALAPILIVLFGIGFSSKVMLAFLMTVISCALATVSGVENVNESMETLLYSLGAARWQVFGKVVVPAVLPWMLGSLRINISLALAGAIVGEFIASGHGLGRMVIYAGTILDTTLVWVGVIVLSLLAMVMYFAVVELEKWMTEHLAIYRKA